MSWDGTLIITGDVNVDLFRHDLDIEQLQKDYKNIRKRTRKNKSESTWISYREKLNEQKSRKPSATFIRERFRLRNLNKCGKSYIEFYIPVRNRLLLTLMGTLNCYFASTAELVTGANAKPVEAVLKLIDFFLDSDTSNYDRPPVQRFYRR